MSRGPYDKSKVKNYTIRSRNRDVMFFLEEREFLFYSLKASDLSVEKVNPFSGRRPEAVLSASHSCHLRLAVKSQSDLQIASTCRIMSQHSLLVENDR